jgi:hypothetical protein
VTAGAPEELTARLLLAAGTSVTRLDIDVTAADTDELDPQVTVARVGLGGLAGTRHITGPVCLARSWWRKGLCPMAGHLSGQLRLRLPEPCVRRRPRGPYQRN